MRTGGKERECVLECDVTHVEYYLILKSPKKKCQRKNVRFIFDFLSLFSPQERHHQTDGFKLPHVEIKARKKVSTAKSTE